MPGSLACFSALPCLGWSHPSETRRLNCLPNPKYRPETPRPNLWVPESTWHPLTHLSTDPFTHPLTHTPTHLPTHPPTINQSFANAWKVPRRMFQGERPQAKVSRRNIQATIHKRRITHESFQTKDSKRNVPSKCSQAKDPKLYMSTKI